MTMKVFGSVLCVLIMAASAVGGELKGDDRSSLTQILGLGLEFSDNVFELDEDGKERLQYPDQDDVDNGRMFGMDTVGDLIVSPQLGFSLDMIGSSGGTLALSSWVKYHFYYNNSEKTYPELNISLAFDIGKRGRTSLSWIGIYNYFKSNALVAVNDENGNGNISDSERVYDPAVYDEYETVLAHSMQLYRNKNGFLSQVSAAPEVGLSERIYNDVFSNRDRDVMFAGIKLNFEWLQALDLALSYRYDDIESPNDYELILYNEKEDDIDVNGDGSIDKKAALVTRVDRSCRRYTLGAFPQLALGKKLKVFAGYEWRMTEYLSDNILDDSHYQEVEVRQKVSAGMTCDFSRRLSAELSGTHLVEETEKSDGYTETTAGLQVKYRFP